jgi:hypothetical protein
MTDPVKAIRDALADVSGLLGKPTLHSGHVIYAETEEWPCVDINVKLAANKLVSPKVARFIAATANPANLAALLKELDALREFYEADKAMGKVLDEVSPGLSSVPTGHAERADAASKRRLLAVDRIGQPPHRPPRA